MLASYFAQIQSHPGWFTINVLVPLLLPFVVIAIVATAIGGWRAYYYPVLHALLSEC